MEEHDYERYLNFCLIELLDVIEYFVSTCNLYQRITEGYQVSVFISKCVCVCVCVCVFDGKDRFGINKYIRIKINRVWLSSQRTPYNQLVALLIIPNTCRVLKHIKATLGNSEVKPSWRHVLRSE